ncbi:MAG: hypothetical protein D6820_11400, partial [Lentisphaerae bacterium]
MLIKSSVTVRLILLSWMIWGVAVRSEPAPQAFKALLYHSDPRGTIIRPSEFNLNGSLPDGTLHQPTACFVETPNTIVVRDDFTDSVTAEKLSASQSAVWTDVSTSAPAMLDFTFNRSAQLTTGQVTVEFDILLDSSTEGYFKVLFRPSPDSDDNAGFQWYSSSNSFYGQLYQVDSANNFIAVSAPDYPANRITAGKAHHFRFLLDLDTNTYSLTIDGMLWHQTTMGTGFSSVRIGFDNANTGIAALDNLTI